MAYSPELLAHEHLITHSVQLIFKQQLVSDTQDIHLSVFVHVYDGEVLMLGSTKSFDSFYYPVKFLSFPAGYIAHTNI